MSPKVKSASKSSHFKVRCSEPFPDEFVNFLTEIFSY